MINIGITMGCPVGIGPEIILRYFAKFHPASDFAPVVIGDIEVLRNTAKHLSLTIACIPWQPGEKTPTSGIPVYSVSQLNLKELNWGSPTRQTGRAMAGYIETGVQLCQQGLIQGMATCPISKKALQKSGYSYPGHTEMLADLTGETHFTMMMAGKKLRVVLVTIHCALQEVPASLNVPTICERMELTHRALQVDFDIPRPRLAVAGLNPHAGEEGLFGREELDIIAPAVVRSREKGIDADGPIPPDTVFLKAAQGKYDAVVCMYHDQGLIPFKLLHFQDGVNVTIGLPIVRTSVDHGTAYDIAGQGIAEADSLAAAVSLAAEIARNRRKHEV